ncbi:hypothetical protein [Novosphingobium sp. ZW T3_23]|uniref:hypothetical protein n=1 Tax=Novosphingobium sp. ZW T3_23 TaxID=3378084 RepID=UPI00385318BF
MLLFYDSRHAAGNFAIFGRDDLEMLFMIEPSGNISPLASAKTTSIPCVLLLDDIIETFDVGQVGHVAPHYFPEKTLTT